MSVSTLQIGEGWFTERGGGLNRYVAELLAHLPAAGVDSRALVVGSANAIAQAPAVVTAVAPSSASMLARSRAFRRAFRSELENHPPDLLVSHFAPYARPLLREARRLPMVVHFHGPWAAESRAEGAAQVAVWLKSRIETSVYSAASVCIVLSEAFKLLLCRDYGIPASRVRVIPGGVDVERFNTSRSRAEARARLGWPIDRPILLSVRRLVRRMGLDHLLAAAHALRERFPSLLIHMAGTGPLAAPLAEQIRELGLEENVRLLGFLPDNDLPLAYRAADLSVVPSVVLEGFGLVAAESLAAGTPAIVTPVGGLPDSVRDLSDDLVLVDTRPESLAAKIAEVLCDPGRLPSADACRQFALARYDWNLVAARVADVYRDAIAATRSAKPLAGSIS